MKMRRKVLSLLLAAAMVLTLWAGFPLQASADVSTALYQMSEGFDDVGTLGSKGWVQNNHSTPMGINNWYQGSSTENTPTAGPFDSHIGNANAYIAANYASTSGSGTIDNWLFTPELRLTNGSVFSFYTRKASTGDYPDRLQILMSQNGSSTSVSDFTSLLTINENLADAYPREWTKYDVTVSDITGTRTGRFAFRYWVTNGGPGGTNSDYIGIDTVSYTVPVPYIGSGGEPELTTETVTAITDETTELNKGWYLARGNITISSLVTVSGDVHLILADDCDLKANSGINVAGDNALTVYGQENGTGKLTATGGTRHAGIGGGNNQAGGIITINGGTVNAQGSNGSAGIGGGDDQAAGGTVAINGGTVDAQGSNGGAGIGRGYGRGGGGTLDITNAIVFASSVTTGTTVAGRKNAVLVIGNDATLYDFEGQITNTATLNGNYIIPAGKTLTVPNGNTLILEDGTLTVNGTLNRAGTGYLLGNGTLINNGSVSIQLAEVTDTGPYTYTGDEITPELTVKIAGTTLTEEDDYAIDQLSDNTDVGFANYIIKGQNHYTEEKAGTFSIGKAAGAPGQPIISTHPQSANYELNASQVVALTVVATPPNNGTLTYQWYSNAENANSGGTLLTDQTSYNYSPQTNTIKTMYYYCEITNTNPNFETETATINSDVAAITVGKISQSAPAKPTLASKTATSITLNTITGAEYSINSEPIQWVDSPIFDGLTPNTTYTFVARMEGTETHNASPNSEPSDQITTDKATLTGTVTISGDATYGEILTANTDGLVSTADVIGAAGLGVLTYQWKRDETPIDSATESTYTLVSADIGENITVAVTAENCLGEQGSEPTTTVAKAIPGITEWPTAANIYKGAYLSASELSGGTTDISGTFEWTTGAQEPDASGNYSVTFTPSEEHETNYDIATETVYITVIDRNALGALIEQAEAINEEATVGEGNGQYTQDKKAIFTVAINTAGIVHNTAAKNNTQLAITNAVTTLQEAIETFAGAPNVVNNTELLALIETATTKKGEATYGDRNGDYALEQETALGEAIDAAEIIAEKSDRTPAEVENAVSELETAITSFDTTLVTVDYDNLADLIELCNLLHSNAVEGDGDGQYEPDSMAVFKAAIEAAELIAIDDHLSQATVDGAMDVLQEAQGIFAAKKVGVNRDVLERLIEQAQEKITNSTYGDRNGDYPEIAKIDLEAAAETALTTVNIVGITQMELDEAAGILHTAIKAFNAAKILVDFDALDIKIAEAKLIGRGSYTTATWDALQAAITSAEAMQVEPRRFTQSEVNGVLSALASAIDGLRHIYIPPPENNNSNNKTDKNDDAAKPAEPSAEIPAGGEVTTPDDKPPVKNPDGSVTLPGGGTITTPDGVTVTIPDGAVITSDGSVSLPQGSGGSITLGSGLTFNTPEGAMIVFDEDAPLGYRVDAENPFTDAKPGDWFYDDVMFAYGHGLMTGTDAAGSASSPDISLTRSMMTTIIYRVTGSPDASGLSNPFPDVANGIWYADAVKWAAANKVVEGYDGRFDPDASITRQDLAVMLLRFAEYKGLELPEIRTYAAFADDKDVSDYARAAVEALYKAGIISGKPGNRLDPKGAATRAEAAAMQRRFLESAGK